MSSEPVMISALNQYVFCPRRCALMHVEGIWHDNTHTTIGALLHDHTDPPGYETDGAVTVLRALPLYSSHYGLVGRADIVEMRAGTPTPVEYKKGKRRRFDNDDIQLCAQALCLEEMFDVSVTEGCIYHAASKRRRQVASCAARPSRRSTPCASCWMKHACHRLNSNRAARAAACGPCACPS